MQIGLTLVITYSLSRPWLKSSKTIQYLIDIVRTNKGNAVVTHTHYPSFTLTIKLHFIAMIFVLHMG